MYEENSHPTPLHVYPGIQQPPPSDEGHAVFPAAQLLTLPEHVLPAGQHPTGPNPVSAMRMHVCDELQHEFGYPIFVQLFVPNGQEALLKMFRKLGML